jgi:iron complex transport system substrate-binding protein
MQTQQVQTAGGKPVWLEAVQGSEGFTVVNFEQIARWNPDKVFVVVWYLLDPHKVVRDIKSDPKWAALKAAVNNQIYAFPSDIVGWDTGEVRWILGVEWLATRIYPERFRNFDMKAELVSFFSRLYGMKKADIEARILPQVKMDAH